MKYEDAAAFILVNMTAWRMLVTQARLRAGEVARALYARCITDRMMIDIDMLSRAGVVPCANCQSRQRC